MGKYAHGEILQEIKQKDLIKTTLLIEFKKEAGAQANIKEECYFQRELIEFW